MCVFLFLCVLLLFAVVLAFLNITSTDTTNDLLLTGCLDHVIAQVYNVRITKCLVEFSGEKEDSKVILKQPSTLLKH